MNALYNVGYFLKLIRWFHGLLGLFPFVTLYFIIRFSAKSVDVTVSGFDFTLLCICVQLLMAIGFIWNDWRDMRIDRINKPETHIIGRKISLRAAKNLFGTLTMVIAVLTTYISIFVFTEWIWISPSVYVLAIAYSLFLKRSPLFGNIAIAVMAAFVPLVLLFFAKDAVAALINDRVETLIYVYAFLLFSIIVPRELSLDISDIEGDKADGCKTLPIVIGVRHSRVIVVFLILAMILNSVFLMRAFPYLTSVLVLVDALLLVYLWLFRKSRTRIELIRAGRFLWLVLIVGIAGATAATLI